jgi:hypothetical protein
MDCLSPSPSAETCSRWRCGDVFQFRRGVRNVSLKNIQALAKALDVPMAGLMEGIDS